MQTATRSMREQLLAMREHLLATPDTICLERATLVTEADQQHRDEPMPVRRAKNFAHILTHMSLDLDSNPIFAGNMSSRLRGWMLLPEYGLRVCPQIAIENEGLDGFLDGRVPQAIIDYWQAHGASSYGGAGIGHLVVNLQRVVDEGLESMLADIERHVGQGTSAQQATRQGMAIALRAVIEWANRYAGAAEAAARGCDDEVIASQHERVARACRRVPGKPARSLFEALQAIVLAQFAIHIEGHGLSVSLGSLDRILARFADEAEVMGDDATELIAAFLLKLAANAYQGNGSKTQAITIGGADEDGHDQCNAVTRAVLDAYDLVRVADPHVFLRWHAGIDESVARKASGMLARGLCQPLLISDWPTAKGFEQAGCTPADAWNYCVIGCNELGIPGRSFRSATASVAHDYLETLNRLLLDAEVNTPAPTSTDALLDRFETATFERFVKVGRERKANWQRIADDRPTPFTSALMDGCIEQGADMHAWTHYTICACYERGLTNAANALAAIDEMVFQSRSLPLDHILTAMRNDFGNGNGAAAVQRALRASPKWGNDDDRADRWAIALVERRQRALDRMREALNEPPYITCHVVRSLHHLDGKQIAASADGRHAFAPVADSIGADVGTATSGPTALLNSVLKLDASHYFAGGTNLNLTLPGSTPPDIVAALVNAFFTDGGQELQISCYSADTLRAAQGNPDRHTDLIVRIAGFNAYFVKLSRMEQDELIARAVAAG